MATRKYTSGEYVDRNGAIPRYIRGDRQTSARLNQEIRPLNDRLAGADVPKQVVPTVGGGAGSSKIAVRVDAVIRNAGEAANYGQDAVDAFDAGGGFLACIRVKEDGSLFDVDPDTQQLPMTPVNPGHNQSLNDWTGSVDTPIQWNAQSSNQRIFTATKLIGESRFRMNVGDGSLWVILDWDNAC